MTTRSGRAHRAIALPRLAEARPPLYQPPSDASAVPFLELLGVDRVDLTRGHGQARMGVEKKHLRDLGIMHGGVLATLLDSVMGLAAGTLAPMGHLVVTVQLNVNFIRPAWQGETLLATGDVLHSGRQTAVARGEVRTEDGTLVGSGSGTFLYILHTDPARAEFARDPEGPPPA